MAFPVNPEGLGNLNALRVPRVDPEDGSSVGIITDGAGNFVGLRVVKGGPTIDISAQITAAAAASLAAIGVPAAFTTRALTIADKSKNLICATAQVATVNLGLASGFTCSFKGDVTFAGTATVTDVRTTGAANPWCSLQNTGTNTYDVVGTKT